MLFDHLLMQIAGWLVFRLKFLPDMRMLQKLFGSNCEMNASWLTFVCEMNVSWLTFVNFFMPFGGVALSKVSQLSRKVPINFIVVQCQNESTESITDFGKAKTPLTNEMFNK